MIITYTCDGRFHPTLRYTPAGNHAPGAVFAIKGRDGRVQGTIKQVAQTYAVIGLMNEHQLAIGETTFGGRDELRNPKGLLHYWWLMQIALARAKTARGAIKVMTELVAEYGYCSTGETFSIADPKEAWIMEMVGPGNGGKGAYWVARRVPDGYICAHANKARIGEFPLDDPDNCLYSPGLIEFATARGYYDPKAGKPFRFCEAFGPVAADHRQGSAGRVWSMLRRAAPSRNFSADYHRGVGGSEPYPLWIKPDKKFDVARVMSIMRDHYEGTPFDMTKGLRAGPFGAPDRCRPLRWEVDGKKGFWERPISTHHTGFSFISESRSWLPDPVGGVFWYGVDNTYTTCYVPLYCGINQVPPSWARGSLKQYSRDSAWWVFNFVATFTNLKYSYMIKDIQKVQASLEGHLLALQPAIDKTATELLKTNPQLLTRYLNDYCVTHAEEVVRRWRDLGDFLITKYNDGYVQDERGSPQERGYPKEWLRRVLKKQ